MHRANPVFANLQNASPYLVLSPLDSRLGLSPCKTDRLHGLHWKLPNVVCYIRRYVLFRLSFFIEKFVAYSQYLFDMYYFMAVSYINTASFVSLRHFNVCLNEHLLDV